MLKKISTNMLRIGMYVSELDRPWTETNFLFQGLLLETPEDIEQVQEQCDYVYIDSDEVDTDSNFREFGSRTASRKQGIKEILSDIPHGHRYPATLGVEAELANAYRAYGKAALVFQSIWNRVSRGRSFQAEEISHAIGPVVNSIIRNPDAFLLLRTVCDEQDYNCRHAINSCALAVSFARHLGISQKELYIIATGAFLLDIGKARLPDSLLYKRGPLTVDELAVLKGHTTAGVEVLTEYDRFSGPVIDMVRAHHERDNGDGYPARLDGNQIPVHARIGALVDCFDAITIERPYKKPLAPHVALGIIREANGVDFQSQLTHAFIRSMGIYPTGSIVELSNGFVATVIEQDPGNWKAPRVMLLRVEDKALEDKRIIIDLGKQSAGSSRAPIEIRKLLTYDYPNIRRIKHVLCVPARKSAQQRSRAGEI